LREEIHIDRLYSVRDIDYQIKNGTFPDFKYSLSDTILFLLMARRKPIKGKIKQMKEVFLTIAEVFKDKVQPVNFVRHRYGPHSEEVEFAIEHLISSNYLSASGNKKEGDFAIKLTPKGENYIELKYNNLPDNLRATLERKRQEWDTFISQGILKLVYTHYSQYLENSVYKRRYEKLDWSNDNQEPNKK